MPRVRYTSKAGMAGGKRKSKKTMRAGQKPTQEKRSKQAARGRTQQDLAAKGKDRAKTVTSFLVGTRKRRPSSDDSSELQRTQLSNSPHSSECERRRQARPSEVSVTGAREIVQSKRKTREQIGSGVGQGSEGTSSQDRGRRGGRGDIRVSSESEGEREGSAHKKDRGGKRFRDVRISQAVVAKWKPVSTATRDLMNSAMVAALGQCLEGLRGSTRRSAEEAIQGAMQLVENEVAAAKAPPAKRVKSTSDLKQRVTELKEKCIDLVTRNEALEERLEERKLFCEEKSEATRQLETVTSTPSHSHSPLPPTVPSSLANSDDKSFEAYIRDLLSPTPLTSLPITHSIPSQETTPSH